MIRFPHTSAAGLALVLLAACSSTAQPVPADVPPPTNRLRSTPSLPASPELEPTTRAQPEWQFESNCSPTERLENQRLSGYLIVQEGFHLASYDLGSQSTRALGDASFFQIASPDRESFAFARLGGEIVVARSNGEAVSAFPASLPSGSWEGFPVPLAWPSTNILLVELPGWAKGGQFSLSSTEVVDLLSATRTLLAPVLSDRFEGFAGPGIGWGPYNYNRAVYDPSLTKVVYPAVELGQRVVVLADLENETEIARIRNVDPSWGGAPQWSSNGSCFLLSAAPQGVDPWADISTPEGGRDGYAGGYEVVLVSREGTLTFLTHFTSTFAAEEQHITWSPDGTKVAFWLTGLEPAERVWIAVVDVGHDSATAYCLEGTEHDGAPVWSPDSDRLALTTMAPDWVSSISVLDLESGQVSALLTGLEAKLWLSAPQDEP